MPNLRSIPLFGRHVRLGDVVRSSLELKAAQPRCKLKFLHGQMFRKHSCVTVLLLGVLSALI